jgi:broad specificity phosphatase PhoE
MRWLELRRHSLTKKGEGRGRGSHLSSEGVALARAVGATLGDFAHVVASPEPRTTETALAMGFAVEEIVDLPASHTSGEVQHHEQRTWPHPYARYAEIIARGNGLADVAARCRAILVRIVAAVPDGTAALVISHGGTVEPALVACLPDADHASWGEAFNHCDGARLAFHDGRFVHIEFRRATASS